jgi:hypothetical protein
LRERGLHHGFGDEAELAHGREHGLGAALGAGGVAVGRQPRGRFHHARQHRGLGDLHLARRLAEIALGGGLDAVGAGAEIDAVEIELENLGLAELALEPEREHELLHLAPERALLGQEQILGELLGEGRAALRHAAAKHVGDHGAGEPMGSAPKWL